MSKGENIFKRKDGRWEARYIKGHELNGKIRYGYCYGKTYSEAKKKVVEARLALASGKTTIRSADTIKHFDVFCDEWLQINHNRIKESTYVKYSSILKKYIKPRLGKLCPEMLTTMLIAQFSDELLKQDGLSAKTVKDILLVLHSILKYTASKCPEKVQVVQITYPMEERKEMRVLNSKEQERLIKYLAEDMDSCRFGILLALCTGMRIGEICALKWGDISLENASVRITATMQRLKIMDEPDTGGTKDAVDELHIGKRKDAVDEPDNGKTKVVIHAPKTHNSMRCIPLTNYAVELCRKMLQPDPELYVLTGTEHYMEPRTLQYRLKHYTDECGLEGVHFHTLRHTFATRCVEADFELKSLSEILGHATTTVTLERYVHSSLELKRKNMSKLSALGL
ncbi:MAG: site-specific integrase [Lachnospiraceae bacterium]|nr:site-specific integrase [Lachnospiraceae bacterium]